MRLLYLSDARIPSRSSNSMQTMRMCAAFRAAGAEVTLVHTHHQPGDVEGFNGDVEQFYGLQDPLRRHPLPALSYKMTDRCPRLSRLLRAAVFATYLFGKCRPRRPPFVCYARSHLAAWIALGSQQVWGRRGTCRAVVLELHDEPRSRAAWRLVARCDAIVAISAALRDRVLATLPGREDRVWVEHDGVDLGAVNPAREERVAARAALGIDGLDGPLVVYTGRVMRVKGAGVLLDASPRLARLGAEVMMVGRVYEPEYEVRGDANVTFTGFVPPADVPRYLAAADILVMPSTSDLPYADFTSPLKLFEYMASGRPLVSADLPVLREVIDDGENALLYRSDDHDALAAAVERLWSDKPLASALAGRAWKDVQYYDWQRRAERILERISATIGLR